MHVVARSSAVYVSSKEPEAALFFSCRLMTLNTGVYVCAETCESFAYLYYLCRQLHARVMWKRLSRYAGFVFLPFRNLTLGDIFVNEPLVLTAFFKFC